MDHGVNKPLWADPKQTQTGSELDPGLITSEHHSAAHTAGRSLRETWFVTTVTNSEL